MRKREGEEVQLSLHELAAKIPNADEGEEIWCWVKHHFHSFNFHCADAARTTPQSPHDNGRCSVLIEEVRDNCDL